MFLQASRRRTCRLLLPRTHRCLGTVALKPRPKLPFPRREERPALQQLLHFLEEPSFQPDLATYTRLLEICATRRSLVWGKLVHAHIVRNGFGRDISLGNRLITMYGQSGSLEGARGVFDKMQQRSTVSWAAMITLHVQHGQVKEAIQLFQRMLEEGLKPTKSSYRILLDACANAPALADCKMLLAHIAQSGLEADTTVGNALLNMYGKCGSVEDARRVFEKIHQREVFSWNAMIGAYVQRGNAQEALQLFQRMQQEGVKPNSITFVSVLSACANLATLAKGRVVHTCIIESGLESDLIVGTALVNMYAKCGSVVDARRVFDRMYQRNVVSWTTMIAAYVQHGQAQEAIRIFRRMQEEGVKPNGITFATVLSACASRPALEEGKMIHACIVESGLESNVVVGNALVNMYAKCGSIEDAWRMFSRLDQRNVVSWNTMIAAHAQLGNGKEALQIFRLMQLEGIEPNQYTFVSVLSACGSLAALAEGIVIHAQVVESGFESDVNVGSALVNMYGKCGSVMDAWRIFDNMQRRNVVSWNTMIAVFVRHRHSREALNVFQWMQREGVKPNKITFLSVVSACASLAALEEGKMVHDCIVESGVELDVVLGSALVNMYGKCESVEDAWKVFDTMHEWNVVLWTAMIAAYAKNGHEKDALQLFQRMQLEAVKPNHITFVTVLGACASLSALAEGKIVHAHIVESGLESNVPVGNALVTMYGKCGSLEDARGMFDKMHQRDDVAWNIMIAAYVQHGQCKEALQLFRQMQQEGMKPTKSTIVSVLSACASLAELAEGQAVRIEQLWEDFFFDPLQWWDIRLKKCYGFYRRIQSTQTSNIKVQMRPYGLTIGGPPPG